MSRLLQCLNPISGYRLRGVNPKTGKHFGLLNAETMKKYPVSLVESVAFRCGKCLNCLKYRGSALMARCVAESRVHDDNAFITLTVDDDHLEEVFPHGSLTYRPFQLFCKRLRKACKSSGIKFMMCAEYGELSTRPHYHSLFFGLAPYVYSDSGVRRSDGFSLKVRDDNPVFQSCWPFGNVYCGSVTPASVAYVSGYTLKQFVLGRDDDWYSVRSLAPEFVKWSRRPGLGKSYFEKFNLLDFHDDGSIDAGVPIDNRRVFAGRYFLDWLRLTASSVYDKLLSSYDRGNRSIGEGSPDEFYSALAERDRLVDYCVHTTLCNKRL